MLGHPLVAATLGILLGVLLTLLSHRAVTFVTPEDPLKGLRVVAVMMGVRFLIALVALGIYYFFAQDGLAAFGISLAVSFVIGLMVEAMRMTRLRASGTSA